MDDNIWEYPFGELEEDDDLFFRKPEINGLQHNKLFRKHKTHNFSLLEA